MPHIRLTACLAVVALLATACVGEPRDGREPVVVGVGSTAEQHVLASLTVAALASEEIPTEVREELGTTVGLRREATNGRIDLFWDYTGAAWALGLGEQAPPADPEESWERVRQADRRNGLLWLEASAADATFALFVRSDAIPGDGNATMSWLAGELSGAERSLCADPDFLLRPGGLDALAGEYAIDLARVPRRPTGEAEAIAAVEEERCFAGLATATSGAARLSDLAPVADDLGVLPAFVAAPVVRAESPADVTEVAEALEPVARGLDTQTLARINAQYEGGGDLEELAEQFLEEVAAD